MSNVPTGPDLLMFVGRQYYPTIKSFVDEAKRHGCCKKFPPSVYLQIEPGVTRVFLVHPEGIPKYKGKIQGGKIFGFFVISKIELIVKGEEDVKKFRKYMKDAKIDIVPADRVAAEPERGCGRRVVGASYFMSDPKNFEIAKEEAEKYASSIDIKGGIAVIDEPVIYEGRHFRGYKQVDGDAILGIVPSMNLFEEDYDIEVPEPEEFEYGIRLEKA